MSSMVCYCGEALTAAPGKLWDVYQDHSRVTKVDTSHAIAPAAWTGAYQLIEEGKERAKEKAKKERA
jgi:hypothetical protein